MLGMRELMREFHCTQLGAKVSAEGTLQYHNVELVDSFHDFRYFLGLFAYALR